MLDREKTKDDLNNTFDWSYSNQKVESNVTRQKITPKNSNFRKIMRRICRVMNNAFKYYLKGL